MAEERTRALRRKNDYTKAIRKKKISDSYCPDGWYDHFGQYIKGKIHCSCQMCTAYTKTNSKGRWCGGKKNWKCSDVKKIEEMDFETKEEFENERKS